MKPPRIVLKLENGQTIYSMPVNMLLLIGCYAGDIDRAPLPGTTVLLEVKQSNGDTDEIAFALRFEMPHIIE